MTDLRVQNLHQNILRNRLITIFVIFSILTAAVTAVGVFIDLRQHLRNEFKQRALGLASIVALQQDGDLHSTIQDNDDNGNTIYQRLAKTNLEIMKAYPQISSVYTLRKNSVDEIYFVVTAGAFVNGVQVAPPLPVGEIYFTAGPTLKENFSTLAAPIVEAEVYTDAYGTWLSAYAPFYRSNGTLEGVVAIDLSAETLAAAEQGALFTASLIFLALIPLLGIAGWLIASRFINPIIELKNAALQIANGDYSKKAEVRSNDEIGQLSEAFNLMAEKIGESIGTLETRVEERTRELQKRNEEMEEISKQTQRRANQMQIVAQVGKAITSIQVLERLLPRVATVISSEFGYYHVGIFLIDDTKDFAVLTASNSQGGVKMIERGHKLKVGRVGIVGYVAGAGRPRIALDTGQDAIFFNNPDLPETRSEMALPLRAGSEIIGVLDVQSTTPSAFTEDDIEVLSVVADQVSIAIQNSRRFQETQKSLSETEAIYRQYLRTEWRSTAGADKRNAGFKYSARGVEALEKPVDDVESQHATRTGSTVTAVNHQVAKIAVPIKLRDEVIGIINVQSRRGEEWNQDEIDIAEAVAERVALAAENARLLETSQSQAARERTISDITSRIGASVNMRNVLQIAVEELGRIMPGSEVSIQIESSQKKPTGNAPLPEIEKSNG